MTKKKGKKPAQSPTKVRDKEDVKDNKTSNAAVKRPATRTYEEDVTYLTKVSPTLYRIAVGFVPNMLVPGYVVVNAELEELLLEELRASSDGGKGGGFLPALKQVANVAALPGIVKASLAMPDVHSGYGFCIGNVAAFDMDDPNAVVSPGGVGFDINCGVRLIRTNLMEDEVSGQVREDLCQALFDHIPVGVGQTGVIPLTSKDLDDVLYMGMDWALREGYAWPEDRENCEENGRMMLADPSKVSKRARKRGLTQLGTLGAGNHYAEVQVIEEIYDATAASAMGLRCKGQVCIMIHSGSRGLGHQVATDALVAMETAMARDDIELNDRQLARRAFSQIFHRTPDDLDMHVVYDVCHNIAKVERHEVDGVLKTLLVHRKGSTRAFPPHHPLVPINYQFTGQPVLIGGTMGTYSYVLVGTEKGMLDTFGSTCHGAGRALSRNASRRKLSYEEVLGNLKDKGISIRVASPKLVVEEAPESYKDVINVVDTCEMAGISRKVVKLRPIAVVKG